MSLGNLIDEKYSHKGIEEILKNYLGESRLTDCVTEVINVVLLKDLPRRTLVVDLDANMEDPEDRTFDEEDLRGHVYANRASLISAFTVVLALLVGGAARGIFSLFR